MAFAFTMNEPQVSKVFRSVPGAEGYFSHEDPLSYEVHAAAAEALSVEKFVTVNHPDLDDMTPQLIAGHEEGFSAIKAERSDLPVGVTLSVTDFQPGGDGSPFEEVRLNAYGEWIDTIKRACDFTGVQTYRSIRIPGARSEYPPLPVLPFTEAGDRQAAIQRPEALGHAVRLSSRPRPTSRCWSRRTGSRRMMMRAVYGTWMKPWPGSMKPSKIAPRGVLGLHPLDPSSTTSSGLVVTHPRWDWRRLTGPTSRAHRNPVAHTWAPLPGEMPCRAGEKPHDNENGGSGDWRWFRYGSGVRHTNGGHGRRPSPGGSE